eukprot:CAMPEP_0185018338 /NCGR_PEP_ID=MMETSP1103-20130426/1096_1 /TAXON_ID=36769 /ORGANISM="Paraphysomonas bandaiensis, Strain Caron Lab Isolate" /LENGTH=231 /DNA_ID=CAMNT_0027548117 /DNA_START=15 /DNA_END=710 /DNA_ORIENTATION=+
MTTAHRPTWHAAVGGVKNHGFTSQQVSAKDQIGMTRLKFRQVGQSSETEMKERDVLHELEKREFDHLSEKNKMIAQIESEEKKVDTVALLKNHAEISSNCNEDNEYNDADIDYHDQDDGFDSSSDEDDDDDDELELQRELERIKEERAQAKAKKEEEEKLMEETLNRESALKGNPLLNLGGTDGNEKVKRKWNDDVVFRHQSRSEPETKKRFINDTIRNDFHRSFLKKYIH